VIRSQRSSHGKASANRTEFRRVFIKRVHQLIAHGYARMNSAAFRESQEPDITGELVKAIDQVLNERSESWMDRFSVYDDPPVNDGRRMGKRRKRVDLRIDSAMSRPRCRFRFESKRLGPRHPISVYLGPEGLGCFLRGDYARDEDEGGMLGYVQFADMEIWADKLSSAMASDLAAFEIDSTPPFLECYIGSGLPHTYHSRHARKAVGRPIVIYHSLLKFH
jgi:hypothetical protein